MVDNFEDDFLLYPEAFALKALGFDSPCFGYRKDDNIFVFFATPDRDNTNSEFQFYPTAPTYQQAFRWIRKRYFLFPETPMYIPQSGNLDGCYVYKAIIKDSIDYKESIIFEEDGFSSVEKAQLACLKKIIEIFTKIA